MHIAKGHLRWQNLSLDIYEAQTFEMRTSFVENKRAGPLFPAYLRVAKLYSKVKNSTMELYGSRRLPEH
jgi:hypothetical protein